MHHNRSKRTDSRFRPNRFLRSGAHLTIKHRGTNDALPKRTRKEPKKPMVKKSDVEKENELLRELVKVLVDKAAAPVTARPSPNLTKRVVRLPSPGRDYDRVPDPRWSHTWKFCPNCKENKLVIPEFGTRIKRGVEYAQPWCKKCRSETNYRALPRKNRTKNTT